ncbi:unnamed protein product [Caenorhabditis bovis]|uniref:Uncharacterized protein n=1 Tax=Caenorhabditis bovis TaxID=2654633 RepID=A0A8S1F023_9PELO|nr:unnamed protein product [Caenorhabditis bovis]
MIVGGVLADGTPIIIGVVGDAFATVHHHTIHHVVSSNKFEAESWDGEHAPHEVDDAGAPRRFSIYLEEQQPTDEETPIASSEQFEKRGRSASLAAALLELDPTGVPLVQFFKLAAHQPLLEVADEEEVEIEATDGERVLGDLLFTLQQLRMTAPAKHEEAVARLRQLEEELRAAGAVTPADPAVSEAVARALAVAGAGRDVQIRVNQSKHTTTTKTVYETETPAMANMDVEQIRKLQQEILADISTGGHDAPEGTTQKKETAEEGFTNEDGSVVVSKKMTRVVTTTRTTLPESPVESLGSVKDRIAKFEQLKDEQPAREPSEHSLSSQTHLQAVEPTSPVDITITPHTPIPPDEVENEPLQPSEEVVSTAEIKDTRQHKLDDDEEFAGELEPSEEHVSSAEIKDIKSYSPSSSEDEGMTRKVEKLVENVEPEVAPQFVAESFVKQEEHKVEDIEKEPVYTGHHEPTQATLIVSERPIAQEYAESVTSDDGGVGEKVVDLSKKAGLVAAAPFAIVGAGVKAAYDALTEEKPEDVSPKEYEDEHLTEAEPVIEEEVTTTVTSEFHEGPQDQEEAYEVSGSPEPEQLHRDELPHSEVTTTVTTITREFYDGPSPVTSVHDDVADRKSDSEVASEAPEDTHSIQQSVSDEHSEFPVHRDDDQEPEHLERDELPHTEVTTTVTIITREFFDGSQPSTAASVHDDVSERKSIPDTASDAPEDVHSIPQEDFATTQQEEEHLQRDELPHTEVTTTVTTITREFYDGSQPSPAERKSISAIASEAPEDTFEAHRDDFTAAEPAEEHLQRDELPHTEVTTTVTTITREFYDGRHPSAESAHFDEKPSSVRHSPVEHEEELRRDELPQTRTTVVEEVTSSAYDEPEHKEKHFEEDTASTKSLKSFGEEPEFVQRDVTGQHEKPEDDDEGLGDKMLGFAKKAGMVAGGIVAAPVALAAVGAKTAYDALTKEDEEHPELHEEDKNAEQRMSPESLEHASIAKPEHHEHEGFEQDSEKHSPIVESVSEELRRDELPHSEVTTTVTTITREFYEGPDEGHKEDIVDQHPSEEEHKISSSPVSEELRRDELPHSEVTTTVTREFHERPQDQEEAYEVSGSSEPEQLHHDELPHSEVTTTVTTITREFYDGSSPATSVHDDVADSKSLSEVASEAPEDTHSVPQSASDEHSEFPVHRDDDQEPEHLERDELPHTEVTTTVTTITREFYDGSQPSTAASVHDDVSERRSIPDTASDAPEDVHSIPEKDFATTQHEEEHFQRDELPHTEVATTVTTITREFYDGSYPDQTSHAEELPATTSEQYEQASHDDASPTKSEKSFVERDHEPAPIPSERHEYTQLQHEEAEDDDEKGLGDKVLGFAKKAGMVAGGIVAAPVALAAVGAKTAYDALTKEDEEHQEPSEHYAPTESSHDIPSEHRESETISSQHDMAPEESRNEEHAEFKPEVVDSPEEIEDNISEEELRASAATKEFFTRSRDEDDLDDIPPRHVDIETVSAVSGLEQDVENSERDDLPDKTTSVTTVAREYYEEPLEQEFEGRTEAQDDEPLFDSEELRRDELPHSEMTTTVTTITREFYEGSPKDDEHSIHEEATTIPQTPDSHVEHHRDDFASAEPAEEHLQRDELPHTEVTTTVTTITREFFDGSQPSTAASVHDDVSERRSIPDSASDAPEDVHSIPQEDFATTQQEEEHLQRDELPHTEVTTTVTTITREFYDGSQPSPAERKSISAIASEAPEDTFEAHRDDFTAAEPAEEHLQRDELPHTEVTTTVTTITREFYDGRRPSAESAHFDEKPSSVDDVRHSADEHEEELRRDELPQTTLDEMTRSVYVEPEHKEDYDEEPEYHIAPRDTDRHHQEPASDEDQEGLGDKMLGFAKKAGMVAGGIVAAPVALAAVGAKTAYDALTKEDEDRQESGHEFPTEYHESEMTSSQHEITHSELRSGSPAVHHEEKVLIKDDEERPGFHEEHQISHESSELVSPTEPTHEFPADYHDDTISRQQEIEHSELRGESPSVDEEHAELHEEDKHAEGQTIPEPSEHASIAEPEQHEHEGFEQDSEKHSPIVESVSEELRRDELPHSEVTTTVTTITREFYEGPDEGHKEDIVDQHPSEEEHKISSSPVSEELRRDELPHSEVMTTVTTVTREFHEGAQDQEEAYEVSGSPEPEQLHRDELPHSEVTTTVTTITREFYDGPSPVTSVHDDVADRKSDSEVASEAPEDTHSIQQSVSDEHSEFPVHRDDDQEPEHLERDELPHTEVTTTVTIITREFFDGSQPSTAASVHDDVSERKSIPDTASDAPEDVHSIPQEDFATTQQEEEHLQRDELPHTEVTTTVTTITREFYDGSQPSPAERKSISAIASEAPEDTFEAHRDDFTAAEPAEEHLQRDELPHTEVTTTVTTITREFYDGRHPSAESAHFDEKPSSVRHSPVEHEEELRRDELPQTRTTVVEEVTSSAYDEPEHKEKHFEEDTASTKSLKSFGEEPEFVQRDVTGQHEKPEDDDEGLGDKMLGFAKKAGMVAGGIVAAPVALAAVGAKTAYDALTKEDEEHPELHEEDKNAEQRMSPESLEHASIAKPEHHEHEGFEQDSEKHSPIVESVSEELRRDELPHSEVTTTVTTITREFYEGPDEGHKEDIVDQHPSEEEHKISSSPVSEELRRDELPHSEVTTTVTREFHERPQDQEEAYEVSGSSEPEQLHHDELPHSEVTTTVTTITREFYDGSSPATSVHDDVADSKSLSEVASEAPEDTHSVPQSASDEHSEFPVHRDDDQEPEHLERDELPHTEVTTTVTTITREFYDGSQPSTAASVHDDVSERRSIPDTASDAPEDVHSIPEKTSRPLNTKKNTFNGMSFHTLNYPDQTSHAEELPATTSEQYEQASHDDASPTKSEKSFVERDHEPAPIPSERHEYTQLQHEEAEDDDEKGLGDKVLGFAKKAGMVAGGIVAAPVALAAVGAKTAYDALTKEDEEHQEPSEHYAPTESSHDIPSEHRESETISSQHDMAPEESRNEEHAEFKPEVVDSPEEIEDNISEEELRASAATKEFFTRSRDEDDLDDIPPRHVDIETVSAVSGLEQDVENSERDDLPDKTTSVTTVAREYYEEPLEQEFEGRTEAQDDEPLFDSEELRRDELPHSEMTTTVTTITREFYEGSPKDDEHSIHEEATTIPQTPDSHVEHHRDDFASAEPAEEHLQRDELPHTEVTTTVTTITREFFDGSQPSTAASVHDDVSERRSIPDSASDAPEDVHSIPQEDFATTQQEEEHLQRDELPHTEVTTTVTTITREFYDGSQPSPAERKSISAIASEAPEDTFEAHRDDFTAAEPAEEHLQRDELPHTEVTTTVTTITREFYDGRRPSAESAHFDEKPSSVDDVRHSADEHEEELRRDELPQTTLDEMTRSVYVEPEHKEDYDEEPEYHIAPRDTDRHHQEPASDEDQEGLGDKMLGFAKKAGMVAGGIVAAPVALAAVGAKTAYDALTKEDEDRQESGHEFPTEYHESEMTSSQHEITHSELRSGSPAVHHEEKVLIKDDEERPGFHEEHQISHESSELVSPTEPTHEFPADYHDDTISRQQEIEHSELRGESPSVDEEHAELHEEDKHAEGQTIPEPSEHASIAEPEQHEHEGFEQDSEKHSPIVESVSEELRRDELPHSEVTTTVTTITREFYEGPDEGHKEDTVDQHPSEEEHKISSSPVSEELRRDELPHSEVMTTVTTVTREFHEGAQDQEEAYEVSGSPEPEQLHRDELPHSEVTTTVTTITREFYDGPSPVTSVHDDVADRKSDSEVASEAPEDTHSIQQSVSDEHSEFPVHRDDDQEPEHLERDELPHTEVTTTVTTITREFFDGSQPSTAESVHDDVSKRRSIPDTASDVPEDVHSIPEKDFATTQQEEEHLQRDELPHTEVTTTVTTITREFYDGSDDDYSQSQHTADVDKESVSDGHSEVPTSVEQHSDSNDHHEDEPQTEQFKRDELPHSEIVTTVTSVTREFYEGAPRDADDKTSHDDLSPSRSEKSFVEQTEEYVPTERHDVTDQQQYQQPEDDDDEGLGDKVLGFAKKAGMVAGGIVAAPVALAAVGAKTAYDALTKEDEDRQESSHEFPSEYHESEMTSSQHEITHSELRTGSPAAHREEKVLEEEQRESPTSTEYSDHPHQSHEFPTEYHESEMISSQHEITHSELRSGSPTIQQEQKKFIGDDNDDKPNELSPTSTEHAEFPEKSHEFPTEYHESEIGFTQHEIPHTELEIKDSPIDSEVGYDFNDEPHSQEESQEVAHGMTRSIGHADLTTSDSTLELEQIRREEQSDISDEFKQQDRPISHESSEVVSPTEPTHDFPSEYHESEMTSSQHEITHSELRSGSPTVHHEETILTKDEERPEFHDEHQISHESSELVSPTEPTHEFPADYHDDTISGQQEIEHSELRAKFVDEEHPELHEEHHEPSEPTHDFPSEYHESEMTSCQHEITHSELRSGSPTAYHEEKVFEEEQRESPTSTEYSDHPHQSHEFPTEYHESEIGFTQHEIPKTSIEEEMEHKEPEPEHPQFEYQPRRYFDEDNPERKAAETQNEEIDKAVSEILRQSLPLDEESPKTGHVEPLEDPSHDDSHVRSRLLRDDGQIEYEEQEYRMDQPATDEKSLGDKMLGFAKKAGMVAGGIVAAPVALAAVGAKTAYDALKKDDKTPEYEYSQVGQEEDRQSSPDSSENDDEVLTYRMKTTDDIQHQPQEFNVEQKEEQISHEGSPTQPTHDFPSQYHESEMTSSQHEIIHSELRSGSPSLQPEHKTTEEEQHRESPTSDHPHQVHEFSSETPAAHHEEKVLEEEQRESPTSTEYSDHPHQSHEFPTEYHESEMISSQHEITHSELRSGSPTIQQEQKEFIGDDDDDKPNELSPTSTEHAEFPEKSHEFPTEYHESEIGFTQHEIPHTDLEVKETSLDHPEVAEHHEKSQESPRSEPHLEMAEERKSPSDGHRHQYDEDVTSKENQDTRQDEIPSKSTSGESDEPYVIESEQYDDEVEDYMKHEPERREVSTEHVIESDHYQERPESAADLDKTESETRYSEPFSEQSGREIQPEIVESEPYHQEHSTEFDHEGLSHKKIEMEREEVSQQEHHELEDDEEGLGDKMLGFAKKAGMVAGGIVAAPVALAAVGAKTAYDALTKEDEDRQESSHDFPSQYHESEMTSSQHEITHSELHSGSPTVHHEETILTKEDEERPEFHEEHQISHESSELVSPTEPTHEFPADYHDDTISRQQEIEHSELRAKFVDEEHAELHEEHHEPSEPTHDFPSEYHESEMTSSQHEITHSELRSGSPTAHHEEKILEEEHRESPTSTEYSDHPHQSHEFPTEYHESEIGFTQHEITHSDLITEPHVIESQEYHSSQTEERISSPVPSEDSQRNQDIDHRDEQCLDRHDSQTLGYDGDDEKRAEATFIVDSTDHHTTATESEEVRDSPTVQISPPTDVIEETGDERFIIESEPYERDENVDRNLDSPTPMDENESEADGVDQHVIESEPYYSEAHDEARIDSPTREERFEEAPYVIESHETDQDDIKEEEPLTHHEQYVIESHEYERDSEPELKEEEPDKHIIESQPYNTDDIVETENYQEKEHDDIPHAPEVVESEPYHHESPTTQFEEHHSEHLPMEREQFSQQQYEEIGDDEKESLGDKMLGFAMKAGMVAGGIVAAPVALAAVGAKTAYDALTKEDEDRQELGHEFPTEYHESEMTSSQHEITHSELRTGSPAAHHEEKVLEEEHRESPTSTEYSDHPHQSHEFPTEYHESEMISSQHEITHSELRSGSPTIQQEQKEFIGDDDDDKPNELSPTSTEHAEFPEKSHEFPTEYHESEIGFTQHEIPHTELTHSVDDKDEKSETFPEEPIEMSHDLSRREVHADIVTSEVSEPERQEGSPTSEAASHQEASHEFPTEYHESEMISSQHEITHSELRSGSPTIQQEQKEFIGDDDDDKPNELSPTSTEHAEFPEKSHEFPTEYHESEIGFTQHEIPHTELTHSVDDKDEKSETFPEEPIEMSHDLSRREVHADIVTSEVSEPERQEGSPTSEAASHQEASHEFPTEYHESEMTSSQHEITHSELHSGSPTAHHEEKVLEEEQRESPTSTEYSDHPHQSHEFPTEYHESEMISSQHEITHSELRSGSPTIQQEQKEFIGDDDEQHRDEFKPEDRQISLESSELASPTEPTHQFPTEYHESETGLSHDEIPHTDLETTVPSVNRDALHDIQDDGASVEVISESDRQTGDDDEEMRASSLDAVQGSTQNIQDLDEVKDSIDIEEGAIIDSHSYELPEDEQQDFDQGYPAEVSELDYNKEQERHQRDASDELKTTTAGGQEDDDEDGFEHISNQEASESQEPVQLTTEPVGISQQEHYELEDDDQEGLGDKMLGFAKKAGMVAGGIVAAPVALAAVGAKTAYDALTKEDEDRQESGHEFPTEYHESEMTSSQHEITHSELRTGSPIVHQEETILTKDDEERPEFYEEVKQKTPESFDGHPAEETAQQIISGVFDPLERHLIESTEFRASFEPSSIDEDAERKKSIENLSTEALGNVSRVSYGEEENDEDDDWKVYDRHGEVLEEFSTQLSEDVVHAAEEDAASEVMTSVPEDKRSKFLKQESCQEISNEPEVDYYSDLQEKLNILANEGQTSLSSLPEEEPSSGHSDQLDVIHESDKEGNEEDEAADQTAAQLVDDVMSKVLNEISNEDEQKTVTSDVYQTATEQSKDDQYDTCVTSQEDAYDSAQGWTSQDSEYTTATSGAPSRLSDADRQEASTPQAVLSPVDSDRNFTVSQDVDPPMIRAFDVDDLSSTTARSTPDVPIQVTIEEEDESDDKLPISPSGVLLPPTADPGRPISPVPPRTGAEETFVYTTTTTTTESGSIHGIAMEATSDSASESRYSRQLSDMSSESHADTVIHKEETLKNDADGSTDSISEGSVIVRESPEHANDSSEHREAEELGFEVYDEEQPKSEELETVEEEPEDSDSLNGGSGHSSVGVPADTLAMIGKYRHTSSDNLSLTSLQEFERLEREIGTRGDGSLTRSELELLVAGKMSRSGEGSVSSLQEFERLEKEMAENQSPPEEVMMLSDIREESEAEDMSIRDDDEEAMGSDAEMKTQPVQEEDIRGVTPLATSPTDSLEHNVITATQMHYLETSTDSLEPTFQEIEVEQRPDSVDDNSLTEYEVVPKAMEASITDSLDTRLDKDSLLEGASQGPESQDTHGLLSGDTVGTLAEDDDKDSLDGEMGRMLRTYPTTLTTFQTTSVSPDGVVQTISRRVETRVTDPIVSHVMFTGTESQERLDQLPDEEQFETVDAEGNVTRTTFRRQHQHQ